MRALVVVVAIAAGIAARDARAQTPCVTCWSPRCEWLRPYADECAPAKAAHPADPDAPGFLTVVTEPAGDVHVDGESLGPTPLRRRPLAPGEYIVSVEAPGRKKAVRILAIEPAKDAKLVLILEPADASPPAAAPEVRAPPAPAPARKRPIEERNWRADVKLTAANKLIGKGSFESAIELLREALDEEPALEHQAKAYRNLGVALARAGRTAEAVDCYRRYLEADPEAPERDRILALIAEFERDGR